MFVSRLAVGKSGAKFNNPHSVNRSFGVGLNMAAAANVIRDNYAGTAGDKTITQDDYDRLYNVGFRHVRWAFETTDHANSSSPYTIDSAYLDFMENHVDMALKAGLGGIVTIAHFYSELMEDPTNATLIERFESICEQCTTRFNNKPPEIVLEPLNEPKAGPAPNAMDTTDWNNIYPGLITAIRGKDTKGRTIMIDCGGAANPSRLSALNVTPLLNDGNIIVSNHQYDPFSFTHASTSGTQWAAAPSGPDSSIIEAYGFMDTFWSANGIPQNIGEWGCNQNADDADKTDWIQYNSGFIKARPWLSATGWVYIKGNFGIFEKSTDTWDANDRDAYLEAN